jgi:hypothetical protein
VIKEAEQGELRPRHPEQFEIEQGGGGEAGDRVELALGELLILQLDADGLPGDPGRVDAVGLGEGGEQRASAGGERGADDVAFEVFGGVDAVALAGDDGGQSGIVDDECADQLVIGIFGVVFDKIVDVREAEIISAGGDLRL